MSNDFGVTFTEEDGKELRPEGLVKLLVRSTGYKADQPSPEIYPTKTGKALKVYFEVVEGKYKGSIVFSGYINYENANPQAQAMGRIELNKLAVAIGLSGIAEFTKHGTQCLKGKLLTADIHTYDDTYNGRTNAKTEIKTYMPKSDLATSEMTGSEILGDDVPF